MVLSLVTWISELLTSNGRCS